MSAFMNKTEAVIGIRQGFGDPADLWNLAPALLSNYQSYRWSAFDRLLSLNDLVTEIDEAMPQTLQRYRRSFNAAFEQLTSRHGGFFLSCRWVLASREAGDANTARHLIGPLNAPRAQDGALLGIISRQLVEASGGVLLLPSLQCVIRGHDDFGCIVLTPHGVDVQEHIGPLAREHQTFLHRL